MTGQHAASGMLMIRDWRLNRPAERAHGSAGMLAEMSMTRRQHHHGSQRSTPQGSGSNARPTRSEPSDRLDLDDDEALLDELAGSAGSLAMVSGGNDGLGAKVLVLNRLYVAVRVVSAKRAMGLLFRNLAEVIHVEPDPAAPPGTSEADQVGIGGRFINYDFWTWADLSQLQAQVEREKHDWIRTVRCEIAVPRIIRLLGYDRLPEQQVKLNRRNLFARDRNQCQYCGRHFPTSDLSIDHVVPRAAGGGDTWENLVCACIRCNARKGGRTPEQAGIKLRRKPERPKRNPLISLRLGNQKYASWKTFLDHAYWSVELR
ncbi:MAG: HNH endonuclease [Planctomycetota bacterium]|nr:HNH endonuclease [Planctomycetota bacterium]